MSIDGQKPIAERPFKSSMSRKNSNYQQNPELNIEELSNIMES